MKGGVRASSACKSPQEYMNMYMKMEYCDVTMETRTNTEIYRCSYKGFKWSKHSQNVSCGSFYNAWAEKCTTLMNESSAFQLFIFHT